jgi:hypothetical protein
VLSIWFAAFINYFQFEQRSLILAVASFILMIAALKSEQNWTWTEWAVTLIPFSGHSPWRHDGRK